MTGHAEFRCRVCGLRQEQATWSSQNEPSYLICPCCGTEFGVDDVRFPEVLDRRNRWLDGDTHWFQPAARPKDWNLIDQLALIPEDWTLESLGIDPQKTAPAIDNDEVVKEAIEEPEYIDFYHFIAQAGLLQRLLSESQIDNFVEHFAELCSYFVFYKDDFNIPESMGSPDGFLPNHQVIFFLNPFAGYAIDPRGTPVRICGSFKDEVNGFWQIDTDEYHEKFGYLDYRLVDPTSPPGTTADFGAGMRCFKKHPSRLPKAFEDAGTAAFSNFLFLTPSILSTLEPKSESTSYLQKLRKWFTGQPSQASILSQYETAIREIDTHRKKEGTLNGQAFKVAQELQRLEKSKLRETLSSMREHYASYATTSLEAFESDKTSILKRISKEGASHFVTGPGFIFAYVPYERFQLLRNSEERACIEVGDERVAGVVNLPEYEEIVQQENRKTRLITPSINDETLLKEDFERVHNAEGSQLFFRRRYWSYMSEIELLCITPQAADLSAETIHATKLRTLLDPRYYAVCEICHNRMQHMAMFNSDACKSCKEPPRDPEDQIVN